MRLGSIVLALTLFGSASRAQSTPVPDPEAAPLQEPAAPPARRSVVGAPPDERVQRDDPLADGAGAPNPGAPLARPSPLVALAEGAGVFAVGGGAAAGVCLSVPLLVLTLALPCTLCVAMPLATTLGAMTGFWAAGLPLQQGPILAASLAGGASSLVVMGGAFAGYFIAWANQEQFLRTPIEPLPALAASAAAGAVVSGLLAAAATGAVTWLLVDQPAPVDARPHAARAPPGAAGLRAMAF